jgi:hypothetical protein
MKGAQLAGCEVAVTVQELKMDGEVPEFESLTPVE